MNGQEIPKPVKAAAIVAAAFVVMSLASHVFAPKRHKRARA